MPYQKSISLQGLQREAMTSLAFVCEKHEETDGGGKDMTQAFCVKPNTTKNCEVIQIWASNSQKNSCPDKITKSKRTGAY